MLEKWTGEVVGTMHIYGISSKALAEKMHINEKYLSGILNCHRKPKDAELRVRAALHDILREIRDDATAEGY